MTVTPLGTAALLIRRTTTTGVKGWTAAVAGATKVTKPRLTPYYIRNLGLLIIVHGSGQVARILSYMAIGNSNLWPTESRRRPDFTLGL
jgi:hypothetical protein